MDELEALFGKPGDPVPEVDPADLKAVMTYAEEAAARHPGRQFAVSSNIYQRICSPGADVRAVTFRASLLGLMKTVMFEPVWAGGHFTDAALKVASKMPLQWMAPGVVTNGFPLNLDQFFAQVHAESAALPASPPNPDLPS